MKKSSRISEKLVSPGLPGLQVATRLIWIGVRLGLSLGLRSRVTVRNRIRVRGKGWGKFGAIVSYSFV